MNLIRSEKKKNAKKLERNVYLIELMPVRDQNKLWNNVLLLTPVSSLYLWTFNVRLCLCLSLLSAEEQTETSP